MALLMSSPIVSGGEGGGGGIGGGALTAVASPNALEGFHAGYGTCQTIEPSVVSVSGSVGTVSYSWTSVSGSASIHASDPTNFTTYFNALLSEGITASGVWKCTVTDDSGNVDSNNVDITLTSTVLGGGGAIP